MTETADSPLTVTSDGHEFIAWGTQRTNWRDTCAISGDETLVAAFLDTLNII
ncbi:hypothetical protein ABZV58_29490 [Nocardia sp. NPDC004654]|uniref:hypothetical protein n=1 Tax=Nocardia sp. NPDC004654 TaxID=3154776 RepID=UPI0033A42BEF